MIYGKGRKMSFGKWICFVFCFEGEEVKLLFLDFGLEIVF